jgi:exosome complex RNA-binding protein Rrp4
MENEGESGGREVVLPGDLLDSGKLKAGAGTYVQDGKIYAAQLGMSYLWAGGTSRAQATP